MNLSTSVEERVKETKGSPLRSQEPGAGRRVSGFMGEDKVKENASGAHPFVQTSGLIEDYQYYSIGLMVFAFSFFVHSGCPFCPAEYSDLYSVFWQVFESGERWFTGTAASLGLPYFDYRFEYPPVIACLFYVSSVVSLNLSRWVDVARDIAFYNVFTLAFLLPAYMFYLKAVKDVSRLLNAHWSRLLFAAAGFGIAYYVVYNFDIIAITFAMFSLLLLIKGKAGAAGFLLGLSVASKIIPGIILLPCLLYLTRRSRRSAITYLVCFSLTIIVAFAPVYLLTLRGLDVMMLEWHVSQSNVAYCENCFYVMIESILGAAGWRLVSQVLMVTVPLGVMWATRNADKRVEVISRSLLMIPVVISVSYTYTPQMNVMIAPTYLLAGGSLMFGALALSDFLNMLIMVFFFRPDMLCRILSIHSCPPSVWDAASPIQWIAFSRIVILWVFIVGMTVGKSGGKYIQNLLGTKYDEVDRDQEEPDSHTLSGTR
jgi:hypothetical protein